MTPARRLGLWTLACALWMAASSAGGAAFERLGARLGPSQPEPACTSPIAWQHAWGQRLGCSTEPALAALAHALQPGDAVQRIAGRPQRLPRGMQDAMRLAVGLPIDPNEADEATLRHVPGLGRAGARAACAHRALHGAFASPAELGRVRGIGPVRLGQALPHLTVLSTRND